MFKKSFCIIQGAEMSACYDTQICIYHLQCLSKKTLSLGDWLSELVVYEFCMQSPIYTFGTYRVFLKRRSSLKRKTAEKGLQHLNSV
jgi:hypothetical protein